MSLVTTNPANQPITVSGSIGGGSTSGQSGQVIFIGASGRATAAVNTFAGDSWSESDRRLNVDAALRAWNFNQGEVNRLQVLEISSGQTSGIIHTSGHPLFTAGLITDAFGRIAQVNNSGQLKVEATANVVTNISGQVVYTTSGNNAVQLYGFDPSGVALRPLIVNASGSNILRVDAGSISVASNISGQVIYTTSGKNDVQMSGQSVYLVSGFNLVSIVDLTDGSQANVAPNTAADNVSTNDNVLVTRAQGFGFDGTQWVRLRTNVSGQPISGIPYKLIVGFSGDPVSISGQPVSISGQTVVANVVTNISGQTVYTASGKNEVSLLATDLSGLQLLPLRTAQSGDNTLAVNIVGPGPNSATIANVLTSIDNLSNTQALKGLAMLHGYDPVLNQWPRIRITTSGQGLSGVTNKLIVGFSGDPVSISGQVVSTSVSGNLVLTSISGNQVLTSISGNQVLTSVSGNMVSVSGQPVNVSGNNVFEYGTVVRTNTPTVVAALSGGTELSSGITFSVTVRNASGNAAMYLGGTGGNAPFSGKGLILFGGESFNYKVDNFNRIRAFAITSGQLLYLTGTDK